MADPVKLKGKLPDNERTNGLLAIAGEIAATPREKRVYVVADAPNSQVAHCTDDETGDAWDIIVPILTVRAIEVTTGLDRDQALKILARTREERQASERNRALELFARDGEQ